VVARASWLFKQARAAATVQSSLHLRAAAENRAYTGQMSILADQIAKARRAAGLTQSQLARKAGVSRTTVQLIETGAVDPQVDTLLTLSRALGLEPLLVPSWLQQDVINFIRSGGKIIGQPPGVGAPLSIVDELLRTRRQ
jgi:transcriptional regulator with XRE-family HTH domain